MAKAYCLIPELAEKMKAAAARKEITIEKLNDMTSAERRELFGKYIDEENARQVNAAFEAAAVKDTQDALLKWVENTFTGKQKKSAVYKDTIAKINDLNEQGILSPKAEDAFLEDLVSSKLGVTVTVEEATKISQMATRLEVMGKEQSEFGTPTLEYFQQRKEIDDYLDSLTPSSRVRVATETIGRGTLLASFKSPFLNIESNTVQGFVEALTRRLQTRRLGGKNNGLSMRYIAFASKVYRQTGYDITRALNLTEARTVRGEGKANTQGKGLVRAAGRVYEDLIFRKTQGLPDVVFASSAFADRANIETTKIAASQKLKGSALKEKAAEIFKDATSLEPKTAEGQAVRNAAMADAAYATYTNKSGYSDFALGLRELFNKAIGDLRAGDQIMPFVKTPANVIGTGIDLSGVVLPVKTTLRIGKALRAIQSGKGITEAFGDNFTDFSRDVIRAGLGISFAYALSSLFKPDDYIGEWPSTPKEQELLRSKNATTNALKIGGKWVSLDYFGPLGATLVGIMYAKKYGTDLPSAVWEYYKGVGRQVAKIPGFDEFYNTIDALKQAAPGKNKSLDEEMRDVANFAIGFTRARTIPSLVSDIAKGTDTAERETEKGSAISQAQAGIPGLREKLPEKYDQYGNLVKTEPLLSVLLFGSRVKTANDTPVLREVTRLQNSGFQPTDTKAIQDGTRASALKEQLGEEKFKEAMQVFERRVYASVENAIRSSEYQKLSDEEKQARLNGLKDKEFNAVLKKYHYESPEPKKRKKSKSQYLL